MLGSCLFLEDSTKSKEAEGIFVDDGVTYDFALPGQQNQIIDRHGGDTITC